MSQELADAKTVALTTYRKDGSGVATPMWIAQADSGLVSMTEADSYKVKRILNNPEVTLVVSDSRGRVAPSATAYSASARVLTKEETTAAVDAVMSKYGMMAKVMGFVNRIRGEGDRIGLEYTIND